MCNGRRQPSRDGTSRMNREVQVRFCERLGVQFPGPTRHNRHSPSTADCPLSPAADMRQGQPGAITEVSIVQQDTPENVQLFQ